MLHINGEKVKTEEKVKYLGDVFNKAGNNKDMIDDRIARGTRCMINSIVECSDITMGSFAFDTQILLYRSMFLPSILYNSEAWCNLNHQDIDKLSKLQLKYLKRVLQVTKSTSNTKAVPL